MNSLVENPMLQSFIAGQEKLDRELKEAEAAPAEEAANKSYYMSASPEQRLYEAARAATSFVPAAEPPLTAAERRGMSEEAFNALRPELRLEIYNQAIFARNGFAKRKRR